MIIEKLYSIYKECTEVSTDTRGINKGCLFIALKGDNFNGNKFANDALKSGAKFVLVDEKEFATTPSHILVEDCLVALQELSKYHRQQLSIPVIGLTGSNGKTTTKELIQSVLKQKHSVFATAGNLNNHIGVPLSLLSIKADHDIAIIEMGANHQKEIEFLCTLSQPNFGVITNIGKAHLEGFGGEEGVKKGKKELYDYIAESNGGIFLNNSDTLLKSISGDLHSIKYGENTQIDADLVKGENQLTFNLKVHHEEKVIHTDLVGDYNLSNALCAACIGYEFGLSFEEITKGLEGYQSDNNRSELKNTDRNTIILDAYNANPSSMQAAILNFSNQNGDKIAILGDMFELGETSEKEHQAISDYAEELKLKCILVGEHFLKVNTYFESFQTTSDLIKFLEKNTLSNKSILIKGSRGMKLEQIEKLL